MNIYEYYPGYTHEEIAEYIKECEETFKLKHGFDWPNCASPECDFKACVSKGSIYCFQCMEAKGAQ